LLCNLGTIIIFLPISLVVFEKILQVLFGDDRKSTSSGCFIGNFDPFSLWTILILPHKLVLFSLTLKHVFVVLHKKKKKKWGKDAC
jgi:hypothetical protein